MNLPDQTPSDLPQPRTVTESTGLEDLEQSLQEAEEMLDLVKARLTQVRSAQQQKGHLEARLSELTAELNKDPIAPSAELSAELDTIKTQLAATWEALESQLITWRDREEQFWQFLRFSGLGFGLALFLNFLARQ